MALAINSIDAKFLAVASVHGIRELHIPSGLASAKRQEVDTCRSICWKLIHGFSTG